jgi:hypothetical protein
LCWFAVAAVALMGLVALAYNLRGPAPASGPPVRSGRVGV